MLVFINIVKEDKIDNNEYKSIKKIRNKMVKILAKLKSLNLSKSRSKNLFRFKKVQNIGTIREFNFLTPNTRVGFTKLRQLLLKY